MTKDEAPNLREQIAKVVFEAMGTASVCWDKDGVFLSEKAKDIGEDAVDDIMELIDSE